MLSIHTVGLLGQNDLKAVYSGPCSFWHPVCKIKLQNTTPVLKL